MSRLLLAAAITACCLRAEKTRTEITKATTPHDDSKANSARVPEVFAVSGQFRRVVILRFKFQADLLANFEKAIAQEKIRNAVILSGIGSLRNYHVHSVSNRDFPSKNIFIRDTDTPADIIGMNGYVIGGRIHAHMTLTDGERSWGGHIEPGNNVFTFAIVTLGVLAGDADLSKLDDKTHR